MDESLFRAFLENEQAVLAEFDASLKGPPSRTSEPSTGVNGIEHLVGDDKLVQTRFEDACRRLADAYIICDSRQRSVMRELIRGLPGVGARMGVSPDQIGTKIDGARFRLALIYESIKDLHPDAKEAARRLERLRLAAIEAGIDPNPHLREVAEMSSDAQHNSRKSMRDYLLFLLMETPFHRCGECRRAYRPDLCKCPHCGAVNPALVNATPLSIGAPGPTGAEYSPVELVCYLPTRQLIGYALLYVASLTLIIMTFCQVSYTFIYKDYHYTRGAWSCKVTILILAVLTFCFRRSLIPMAKAFVSLPNLGVTWKQFMSLIGVGLGLFAAIVAFLSFFGRDLGW
jgi:hypothetical protein